MGKQAKNTSNDVLKKLEDAIVKLKQQQKQAQVTWDKCQGAIEVLESFLEEENGEVQTN
jgi:ABC-type transporter Mla subunit MlaD